MKITRSELQAAVTAGIIAEPQSQALWDFWTKHGADKPGFGVVHVLYYLGGMIAIGAMTLFMTVGFELFGGWAIFGLAVAYALAGILLANHFLYVRKLPIPAGIMAAFVVALTPLAVYGLQHGLGLWQGRAFYRDYHYYIDWNWLLMELATLAVGAVMAWRYRLPFLLMPVAVTLWYISMDLAPFLFGGDGEYVTWELRRMVSLYFGALMIGLAFWIDVRSGRVKDYAFWIYLFGVAAFWCGLSFSHSDSQLAKFAYCMINVAMIFVGVVLSRRVFAVFGGLGVAGYLGYLSWEVFKHSMMFPFALTLIGIGVIWIGVLWQKHESAIAASLRAQLPGRLRVLIENIQET